VDECKSRLYELDRCIRGKGFDETKVTNNKVLPVLKGGLKLV